MVCGGDGDREGGAVLLLFLLLLFVFVILNIVGFAFVCLIMEIRNRYLVSKTIK
jgi:hypothetical protein